MLVLSSITGVVCGEANLLWPVDAKPALTSTFCEYRSGHFHSGIDLKTYGKVGLPCFEVADGYVVRVRTSPVGYGKTLYLESDNGLIFVYAHLDGFAPEIDHLIRTEQERIGIYEIDITMQPADRFRFKRGDVICYAGQSGVKHPHLHFEIRESWNEVVNPLKNGYPFPDHRPPVPTAIAIVPINENSTVEKDNQPRIYSGVYLDEDGIYRTREPIGISGNIGVSLEVYDKADKSENILAPYRVEFKAEGESVWTAQFDRFNFQEDIQVEVQRDYLMISTGNGEFHRLYRVAGNSLFPDTGDGIVFYPDDRIAPLQCDITIDDAAGNVSHLEFEFVSDRIALEDRLVSGTQLFPYRDTKESYNGALVVRVFNNYFQFAGPPGIAGFRVEGEDEFLRATPVEGGVSAAWKPPVDFDGKLLLTAYDRNDHFITQLERRFYPAFPDKDASFVSEDETITLEIPHFAVYDTTWFWFKPEPSYQVPGFIESAYSLAPTLQPFSVPVTIGIKQNHSQFESGWGIYSYSQKNGWIFEGNEINNRFLTARTRNLGIFSMVCDTDTPSIQLVSPVDSSFVKTNIPRIEVKVKDQISGIDADGIVMKLDGKTLPAEYDPPRDRIIYQTWQELMPGEHLLEVIATDRVGNRSVRTASFTVVQHNRRN